MQLKNIAIAGAAGNVGSAVVKELLKDGHFQVTAVVRPTSEYNAPKTSNNISTVTADFEDYSSLVNALRNQDALLCCIPGGQTKFASQKRLIDAAIAARVKLFFASEYSADIFSPHYSIFPTQLVGDKVQIRKYLEEKAAANEIAYTALNQGPFFEMWLRLVAGFDIEARKVTIYGSGNTLSCWTPLSVAATAVVNMLRNPDAIKNRGIFISGIRDLTQNNILAALEAETGDKFEVNHVDIKKIKADAHAALEKGEYGLAFKGLTINSNFNEEDSRGNFWDKVENELVGVKAVGVREAIKAFSGCRER